MELKNRPKRQLQRNLDIVALRAAGMYYGQIAKRYNISIARARQIIEAWEGRDDKQERCKT